MQEEKRFYAHNYERGAEIIKNYVQTLPDKAGVYRMIGIEDKVLYVGKAKNLKNRVTSYTRATGLSNRIMRMVSMTQKMEFIVTKTESEAFLLEADLIKNLKPHFNVLLKDDKSYPYIIFTKDHEYAKISKYRGIKKIGEADYFGPFASNQATEKTLEVLQKAFFLRSCNDYDFAHRSRPCILHQIKRCSAPCTGEISLENYKDSVKTAKKFLTTGSKNIVKDLTNKMYELSENMDFEGAALYRDRIKALTHTFGKNSFYPETFTHADIISITEKNGEFCVHVLFYRAGQNWGGHSYFPKASADTSIEEVLDGFLGQFYQNKPPAPLILLSHKIQELDILKQALETRYDGTIEIEIPEKGERFNLIKMAFENASLALLQRQAMNETTRENLEKISELFDLSTIPSRIEIYDNAHISGSHAVGAMVVMTPDGFDKKHYRTWNMKNPETKTNDDYAMMREVFTRRFQRILEDKDDNPELVPDLILLDGGQGQLSTVLKIAEEYNIDIPIIGVAKGSDRNAGRERFFMKDKDSFLLEPQDPTLYFIQKMRDEAHRFANGTHAKKRKRDAEKQTIDQIEGIGGQRRKALLAKFGSNRAIAEASIEELLQTPNISEALAEKIYNFFRAC